MPRNAKTVLGWASLAPEGRAPLPHQPPPQEAQPGIDLPLPPPVTIHPRRARRPRSQRPQPGPPPPPSPPAYRASPLTAPLQPLPPVLPTPTPAPQPALDDASFDDAAPTLCDLPILEADTTARIATRARAFEKVHLHLLGAILLQIAGVLAHDDPELHVEGAIALYASVALMLWCVIRIVLQARA